MNEREMKMATVGQVRAMLAQTSEWVRDTAYALARRVFYVHKCALIFCYTVYI